MIIVEEVEEEEVVDDLQFVLSVEVQEVVVVKVVAAMTYLSFLQQLEASEVEVEVVEAKTQGQQSHHQSPILQYLATEEVVEVVVVQLK